MKTTLSVEQEYNATIKSLARCDLMSNTQPKIAHSVALIILCLFSSLTFAQEDSEIEKALRKQFEAEEYNKCYNLAKKYHRRNASSEIPFKYLCLLEIENSKKVSPLPDKKQWKYLKEAIKNAESYSENDSSIANLVGQEINHYVKSWNDTNFSLSHIKTVLNFYTSRLKDTIPVYWRYFPESGNSKHVVSFNSKADSLRDEIIKHAVKWIGTSYRYGGANPTTGFDCSGYTMFVYKHIGINIPHGSQSQSQINGKILTLEEAKSGDLVFFGKGNTKTWKTQHAGIFMGTENGQPKIIHSSSRGVVIDGNNSSWESYWKQRVLFVIRVPELE